MKQSTENIKKTQNTNWPVEAEGAMGDSPGKLGDSQVSPKFYAQIIPPKLPLIGRSKEPLFKFKLGPSIHLTVVRLEHCNMRCWLVVEGSVLPGTPQLFSPKENHI